MVCLLCEVCITQATLFLCLSKWVHPYLFWQAHKSGLNTEGSLHTLCSIVVTISGQCLFCHDLLFFGCSPFIINIFWGAKLLLKIEVQLIEWTPGHLPCKAVRLRRCNLTTVLFCTCSPPAAESQSAEGKPAASHNSGNYNLILANLSKIPRQ